MKAISLWQPWASLIAIGAKPYETRSWMPPRALIGQRIAIHAAMKGVDDALEGVDDKTVFEMESALEFTEGAHRAFGALPRGAIVCTAVLQSAERIDHAHEFARLPPDLFGDYSVGRCVWRLTNVQTFPPIPCKGRQRWFDAPAVLG